MEIYLEFAKWLDGIFENNHMPKAVKAYCFNIYEEEDENGAASGEYGVQLIASDEFDENDGGDWACSEIWSSEENIFYIDHSDEKNADYSRGQQFVGGLVKDYLESGKCKDIFLSSRAVAAGFVTAILKSFIKLDK